MGPQDSRSSQERDPQSTKYMLAEDKVLTSLGTEFLQAESRGGKKKKKRENGALRGGVSLDLLFMSWVYNVDIKPFSIICT